MSSKEGDVPRLRKESASSERFAWWFGLAAVLSVAAWARLSHFAEAFVAGEPVPLDGDCLYHFKRILEAADRFPLVQIFDPALNWPSGAVPPWPAGFDLLGAAFALLGGKVPEARALLAMLFPVVLGLLVVWATIDLALQVLPQGPVRRPAALAAGLLAALIRQGVATSRFGRIDHHVAEALSLVLLGGWLLRSFSTERISLRGRILWELAGALIAVFAVWSFSGGSLYVALAAAALLPPASWAERPSFVGSGAPALAAGAVAVAGLAMPAVKVHGQPFSFVLPSLLPAVLLAVAASAVGGGVLISRTVAGWRHRIALLAGSGLACFALATLVAPGPLVQVRMALTSWLMREDPWIGGISEFQPLWRLAESEGGWTRMLHYYFGLPGLLAPALVLVGLVSSLRNDRARGAVFTWLLLAICGLTFFQLRFGRVAVPFLAVAGALAFAALARRAVRGRFATLFPLAAVGLSTLPDPAIFRQLLVGSERPVSPVVEAALDLRASRSGEEKGGVLCKWDWGHHFHVLSGLPVRVDPFGSHLDRAAFEEAERVPALAPAALDALMLRNDLGYLAAGAAWASPGRPPFAGEAGEQVLNMAYMISVPSAALLLGGSGIPGQGVPHLPHLLPRFSSTQTMPGLAFALPMLWTFERVPGATLQGMAKRAGARVVAELEFWEHGRPHRWKGWTDASEDRRYELTVPFPSGYTRGPMVSAPSYSVQSLDGPGVSVAVPESAVRAGASILVPSPP